VDKAEALLEAPAGAAPSSSPPGASCSVGCPHCPLSNFSTQCQGQSSWVLWLVFLVLVVGREL